VSVPFGGLVAVSFWDDERVVVASRSGVGAIAGPAALFELDADRVVTVLIDVFDRVGTLGFIQCTWMPGVESGACGDSKRSSLPT
jgi:hypothetical protein